MKRNYHCKDCQERYIGCHSKCDKYKQTDPFDERKKEVQDWYDYTLKRKW